MKNNVKILSIASILCSLLVIPAKADTINYNINYGSITNNNTTNNINNSINNTNINLSNYNINQNNYNNVPSINGDNSKSKENLINGNAPETNKAVTIGENVAYNNETGTGWIKRNDDNLIYYENHVQAINEWKKFQDGYRHFNSIGVMDHKTYVDGLWLQDDGTVKTYGENDDLMPGLASEKDINYIKHTLDVFGYKYDIEYRDTDKRENDNIVCSANKNLNTKTYTIVVYKYQDRTSFIK